MRRALPVALLLLGACAPSGTSSTTTGATPTTVRTTVGPTSTSTTVSARSGCGEGPAMTDSGTVLTNDPPTTDTLTIGELTWSVDEGCEQFRIGFQTAEGAPATTPPPLSVELLPGILRIRLGAEATVITDQLVETPLVRRLFVVRSLAGGLFVDLHLTDPVRARAAIDATPAELRLDLEPGGGPSPPPPLVGELIVVTSPANGADVPTTLTVSGYARTPEGNVTVAAMVGNEVFATTRTVAADWAVTWGEFQAPILLPAGQVSLFVGEENAPNGRPRGVTLGVTAR